MHHHQYLSHKVNGRKTVGVENMEEMHQHFLHEHPLKLVPVGSEDGDIERICAAGCDDASSGHDQAYYYACDPCGFYLHQSCGDLPRRIEHPFHPCPLFLKLVKKSKGGMRLSYRCEACEFEMDAASGSKKFQASSSEEERHLLHFTHPHPLVLIHPEEEEEDAESSSEEEEAAVPSSKARKYAKIRCKGCHQRISGSYYGCRSCRYYLDESCANLPREIRHFFHQCPLFLEFLKYEFPKYKSCDACFTNVTGFGYRCEECDFNMEVDCARFMPIGSDDKLNKILNWSHHHPLELFKEAEGKDSLECDLCCKGIAAQAYGACKQCRFHIHKTCMDLPREIQHHCHPCPIFLKLVCNLQCGTCLSRASRGFAYECRKCWFEMDVECAIFSAASTEGGQAQHIIHFCHHHPLKVYKKPIERTRIDVILNRKLECFVCRTPSSGSICGCRECDVFLHKPCLDVLPQILSIGKKPSNLIRTSSIFFCWGCNRQLAGFLFDDHWGHRTCVPCALKEALSIKVNPSSVSIKLHTHPCSLILKSFATFNCNACFTRCHSHAYYCDLCDFYVGLKCAQNSMTSSADDKEQQIQHFCHWHPLQSSGDVAVPTSSCRICGVLCSEPSYFCGKCDYHVHKSCLDILPQKIDNHYFQCTLVLLTTLSFECILCQKENDSGLAFRSIENGFKLCTECYIMPKSTLNDNGTFTSIHHWHPLSLTDVSKKDARCLLCGGHISGSMSYYCKQCDCHIHRACAELPFEMQHPLHPLHRLTLISSSQLPEQRRSCSLCLRVFSSDDASQSGVYHCKGCSFQLDRKCASTCIPSIKYQGESHLLTVVDNMYGDEDCRVCSTSCKSKSVFRCVECKMSLHLCCGPLPCDIKHPCHVHPLVLEDFYAEENYTDMFPCHVCEEKRDPMLPVYRCAEGCPMICEIRCAIPEIMSKLLGDHGGDVELRTTFPNVKSEVIPRDEIFKHEVSVPWTSSGSYMIHLEFESADIFVSKNMKDIIQDWEIEMLQSHGEESESANHENEDADDDHRNSCYSLTKEAFTHFSSNFGCTPLTLRRVGIPKFISQHSGKAKVGCGYRLPLTLFSIRQEFFGRYHRNDSVYRKDDTTRSFVISIAFAVIHNMRVTKVVNVTSKRVRKWLTLLNLVERAGYDVGFVVEKIKRVWEAHFLIKAKAIVDDTSDRLSREHERLSRREEELLRELEATRKQKEEINEQEQRHHKYAGTGMRSLRKEYADVLLIKWKPASTAILDCRDQLWDVLVPGVEGVSEKDPEESSFGDYDDNED